MNILFLFYFDFIVIFFTLTWKDQTAMIESGLRIWREWRRSLISHSVRQFWMS